MDALSLSLAGVIAYAIGAALLARATQTARSRRDILIAALIVAVMALGYGIMRGGADDPVILGIAVVMLDAILVAAGWAALLFGLLTESGRKAVLGFTLVLSIALPAVIWWVQSSDGDNRDRERAIVDVCFEGTRLPTLDQRKAALGEAQRLITQLGRPFETMRCTQLAEEIAALEEEGRCPARPIAGFACFCGFGFFDGEVASCAEPTCHASEPRDAGKLAAAITPVEVQRLYGNGFHWVRVAVLTCGDDEGALSLPALEDRRYRVRSARTREEISAATTALAGILKESHTELAVQKLGLALVLWPENAEAAAQVEAMLSELQPIHRSARFYETLLAAGDWDGRADSKLTVLRKIEALAMSRKDGEALGRVRDQIQRTEAKRP